MEHCRLLRAPSFALKPNECEALERLAARALALRPCREPAHYMVTGHGVADKSLSDASADDGADSDMVVARALASRLAAEVAPGCSVISVRLLLSPPGAPAQQWHLDYARHFTEVQTVFVAVSPSTANNCTEVLELGVHGGPVAAMARRAPGPLPAHRWQRARVDSKVRPLVCAQWDVCVLRTSHAFHRRGANKSDFVRITFNVDIASLTESPGFVDVDMQRSLAEDRLCGQEYVDDLGEQDVSLEDHSCDATCLPDEVEGAKQVYGGG